MKKKPGKGGKSPKKSDGGKTQTILSMFRQQSMKQTDQAAGEGTSRQNNCEEDNPTESQKAITTRTFSKLSTKRKLDTISNKPAKRKVPSTWNSSEQEGCESSSEQTVTASNTNNSEVCVENLDNSSTDLSHSSGKNAVNEEPVCDAVVNQAIQSSNSSSSKHHIPTKDTNRKRLSLKRRSSYKSKSSSDNNTQSQKQENNEMQEDVTNTTTEKIKISNLTQKSDVLCLKDGISEAKAEEQSTTIEEENSNIIVHEDGTIEYKIPYYLENFLLVVNSVVKDTFFDSLFNEEDRQVIENFFSLSGMHQYLILLC